MIEHMATEKEKKVVFRLDLVEMVKEIIRFGWTSKAISEQRKKSSVAHRDNDNERTKEKKEESEK